MKYRKLFLIAFGAVCFFGTASFVYLQTSSKSNLKLIVSFPKEIYKLGEPINPTFELRNEGGEPIVLWDKFGVETGFLRVLSIKDGKKIVGFGNSRWGVLDSLNKTFIQPNETKTATAGILWHNGSKGEPEFSLTEAGDYYFKIKYSAFLKEGGQHPTELESEQVKITVEEPQGEDLEVWNKIKDDGDFAYFIQEGEILIPDYKPKERAEFELKVENIINQYPNSFYVQSLNQSLEKFKTNDTKRRAFEENIKANKP